jgi:hypothetical protein
LDIPLVSRGEHPMQQGTLSLQSIIDQVSKEKGIDPPS